MYQIFRDLTKNRTETSRAVILSHIALPDTLKKGIPEEAWQRRKSLVHGHRAPSLLSRYMALKYKNQVKNRFQLRYRSSYYHATFTAASFILLCLLLTCHIRLFKNNSLLRSSFLRGPALAISITAPFLSPTFQSLWTSQFKLVMSQKMMGTV